jgi:hypothetical protein
MAAREPAGCRATLEFVVRPATRALAICGLATRQNSLHLGTGSWRNLTGFSVNKFTCIASVDSWSASFTDYRENILGTVYPRSPQGINTVAGGNAPGIRASHKARP